MTISKTKRRFLIIDGLRFRILGLRADGTIILKDPHFKCEIHFKNGQFLPERIKK